MLQNTFLELITWKQLIENLNLNRLPYDEFDKIEELFIVFRRICKTYSTKASSIRILDFLHDFEVSDDDAYDSLRTTYY